MDLPQRMAFIVQPNRLQGLIWQALLKSQGISAILESASAELTDCLEQVAAAGLTLPEMIILDANTPGLNPYEFCRWCRERFPKVKVFLTRVNVRPLTEAEGRWAINQGATGFFNGFTRETLMSTAVVNIKQILSAIGEPFLDEQALLTVLLNIRRQTGTAKAAVAARQPLPPPVRTPKAPPPPPLVGSQNGRKSVPTQPNHDLGWVTSGLESLSRNRLKASAPAPETGSASTLEPAADWRAKPMPGASTEPGQRFRGVSY